VGEARELAEGRRGRELAVAERVVEMARGKRPDALRPANENTPPPSPETADIGFFLVGPRREELERSIGYQPPWHQRLMRLYRGSGWLGLAAPVAMLTVLFLWLAGLALQGVELPRAAALGLLALFAAICAIAERLGPQTLARLEQRILEFAGTFLAPDTVAAGTTLTFRNDSAVEYHEVAVLRIADDESRSIQELLELPEEESMRSLEFVGVASALPETEGDVLQGTLTLTGPGRYALLCFIPQGADPDAAHAAFHALDDGPPPDLGDGVPHAFLGMVHELTVE
jgi:hypothetical protein